VNSISVISTSEGGHHVTVVDVRWLKGIKTERPPMQYFSY